MICHCLLVLPLITQVEEVITQVGEVIGKILILLINLENQGHSWSQVRQRIPGAADREPVWKCAGACGAGYIND